MSVTLDACKQQNVQAIFNISKLYSYSVYKCVVSTRLPNRADPNMIPQHSVVSYWDLH